MKVHILQHVPFEDIGSMAAWLERRGATLSYTRFFESPVLPDPGSYDLIIAMGGPMSVNDEAKLPWLVEEKRFLREAMALEVPVLGVCLGAQLIASALGARVRANPEREIGWFDIQGISGPADAFRFPPQAVVFHWHGETFDLPPDAIHLARSAGCENQAFQVGARVIGLQFHLETTPESADAIITHCCDELTGGQFVQDEVTLRAASASDFDCIHGLMDQVLDYLTRHLPQS